MAAAANPKPKTSPKSIKFLFGGLAGMGATVFVQPLDLVKNRMQLSGQGSKAREYKTSLHALASILRNEGVGGIYTGLSAGLLRQATYTTTRLGIYTVLFERMTKADGTPPNFFMKALIGMTAGATGAFVGTPAEVALIRMTADGRLPPDQRRGYRYFGDDILCHFCASMISGLVTTAASMPVDIVKTRIQNMRMIDGKPEYKNGLDVLLKVIRNEGFFSLWKGFTPYYARLGPHTVLTFIFLEQMNKIRKRIPLSPQLPVLVIQSKMADLLGSILSSMEKPPTVGDQESRRKAREQAARMKKMQEDEKKKKAEFRKRRKYDPMGKIERSILHDVAEVAGLTSFSFGEDEESRYVMIFKKEQAALDAQAANQEETQTASPSSNYRDKYSHLIGTSAAKDAAHTLQANRAYGCVPVANKRDTRSIEEAMNEIRAKKRLKKGEEEGGATGSGSS
ncbi:hypothetical protein JZ751_024394 [Albula glossodonta]|uniref:R3H domain-containing protein n=1 Tax=Albula glossodonta TaxID=121402 RepID=A0A8T2NGZ4_9TELE|nr:hypothetical protein JZ751_024394 [Albula glossodonta]